MRRPRAAVVAFTRSLSAQLANKGIRVHAIAPGPIWPPLISASFDKKEVAEFGIDVPLAAPAAERGSACVSISGFADSTYFIGQVLHPNGGVILNS
jgi:NAD(P)-dependent dehydrogenase (short-subunit alcohol dehydrogenase family)